MENALVTLLLAKTYENAGLDYQRAVRRPGFPVWDYVILTASNEHQAEGFRAQLAERVMPAATHIAVIPDPEGKRVGSGGATLGVINYIQKREAAGGHDGFDGLRILVIHSGGDSKRTPQYSALGKLFSPVPHELPDGRSATLFDEIMISVSGIPARIPEGMLLVSGDVLMLFNPLQIEYNGTGAAAVSFDEDVRVGKNHGVYLMGADGNVARCLQKKSAETLRAEGAVNERGRVNIDTGAVFFSSEMISGLYRMAAGREDAFINDRVRLSLYADFLYPLGSEATLAEYLKETPEGGFSEALGECRRRLWEVLRPYRMKLLRPAPARFIHFGTTAEVMKLMSDDIAAYRSLGWSKVVNSCVADGVSGVDSVLSGGVTVGSRVHLESAYVHPGSVIGSNVILSYVDIDKNTVPDNVVLHGLRQLDGRFVVRIFGISDNPKENMLFGRPLTALGIGQSLWDAKLYVPCDTMREAVEHALALYEIVTGGADRTRWEKEEKTSLCGGFNDADTSAVTAWNRTMRELVTMELLKKDISDRVPVSRVKSRLCPDGLTEKQREWLDARLSAADSGEAMRLHYYLGRLLCGAEGEKHIDAAFAEVRSAVIAADRPKENPACRITKETHTVRLPLRVNFGGGWSDTPPYCIENGGTVLNAAVLLDDRMPVEVTVRRLSERKVVFDSRDMDVHGEFTDIRALQTVGGPYDPFVLQKAALLATGIIPTDGGDTDALFDRLGGGIFLGSEVIGVPKGSGLGTSSILAAACAKGLTEFVGIPYTTERLYGCVSVMEQIMSTGGGWQDQVGGLSNGIKYIWTRPGARQTVTVETVDVPSDAMRALKERFALIYTGQRRLARNLLRDAMGRYIGNEEEARYALNEIQRVAALMRFELERGHIDAFAALLNEHWRLSKMIDAECSNTLIEQIFATVDEYIDGRMVCGAGGGGFLQVILKKGVTREQLRQRLREVFEGSAVDVYDATLI